MRRQSGLEHKHGGVGMLRLPILFLLPLWLNSAPIVCHGDELPRISPSLERLFAGKAPRGPDDLLAMEQYIQALSKKALEATVSIKFGAAHGSGVIVSQDGLILTAAHVTTPQGGEASIRLFDGREVSARALGRHFPLDASMLKINAPGPWPFLKPGGSKNLKPGHWCLATGHPGGYQIKRGPVVRLGRILQLDSDLVRTDCRLSGGDSGGPLVDMRGRVIGIHSRIGTSLANNLHILIDVYRDHWEGLVGGHQWRGSSYLGVRGQPQVNQALITGVQEGSPAAKADIRVGDVITRFGGQRVFAFEQLPQLVQMRRPGEDVEVELLRKGEKLRVDVRVAKRPPTHE